MTVTMQEVLDELERVMSRLAAAHVEAFLVGGVAVHLWTTASTTDEDDDEWIEVSRIDEVTLMRLGRVTEDIDLGIPPEQIATAKRALLAGMSPDSKKDFRFHGRDAWVDVLELPTPGTSLTDQQKQSGSASSGLALLPSHFVSRIVGGRVIRLATPEAIVVLKALAWTDRYADKDLIDVARIALLDIAQRGSARDALATIAPTLPERTRLAIDRTRGAFSTPDSSGSLLFARFAQRIARWRDAEWEEAEEIVSKLIHQAVTRLLSGVESWR